MPSLPTIDLSERFSPSFAEAWRSAVCGAMGWRTEGPFVRVPSLSARTGLSYLPFLNYTDLDPEAAAELATTARRSYLIRALGRPDEAIADGAPCVLRLPLGGSAEEVLAQRVKPRCRTKVRRALEGPVRRDEGPPAARVGPFYSLFQRTQHRHGLPVVPRRLIDALVADAGAWVELGWLDDEVVSGALVVRDEGIVWVPWAASDAGRDRDRAYAMYWGAIAEAAEAGARLFDFGRSPKGSGTDQFKRQWGAERVPVHHLEPRPGDTPYARYEMATEVWRRLPRWIVDRLGPPLTRFLIDY